MKTINILFEKIINTTKKIIMMNIGKEGIIGIEEHLLKKSSRGTRDLDLNTNMLKDNQPKNGRSLMISKLIRTKNLFQNRADVLLLNLKAHL